MVLMLIVFLRSIGAAREALRGMLTKGPLDAKMWDAITAKRIECVPRCCCAIHLHRCSA